MEEGGEVNTPNSETIVPTDSSCDESHIVLTDSSCDDIVGISNVVPVQVDHGGKQLAIARLEREAEEVTNAAPVQVDLGGKQLAIEMHQREVVDLVSSSHSEEMDISAEVSEDEEMMTQMYLDAEESEDEEMTTQIYDIYEETRQAFSDRRVQEGRPRGTRRNSTLEEAFGGMELPDEKPDN